MPSEPSTVESDRVLLQAAQQAGLPATLKAFVRLSGPGWLQSAITLGGGSLGSALFLGILGGYSLLWLQLVAITMGVVMLSAISYITLTTGERPFPAIRREISPVLAWGWLLATVAANIIWCMPQFSLCFAAIENNLLAGHVEDRDSVRYAVSAVILLAAAIAVYLNGRQGRAARAFDIFLKCLVGMIVLCFVGVVVRLTQSGRLPWSEIRRGFIPDLSQWTRPTGTISELLKELPSDVQAFWSERVVRMQSGVMIAAAATAVGINMTFLMPYSLLKRGWDRTFRGLSRFDLATGMAIPYVAVTGCIVIVAASQFHGRADEQFLSGDPAVMAESRLFPAAQVLLKERLTGSERFRALPADERGTLTEEERKAAAALPAAEKRIVASVIKRDAFHLSKALEPLLGERVSRYVFGLGILGMGFSTIIILMLINGFAFCEAVNRPLGGRPYLAGCFVAGAAGACWPYFWTGQSKVYLTIVASSFGSMLLPIAYITFFLMMNSRRILGDERPSGVRRVIWNVLMAVSAAGAVAAAGKAIGDQASDPQTGPVVMTVAAAFGVAVLVDFLDRRFRDSRLSAGAESGAD